MEGVQWKLTKKNQPELQSGEGLLLALASVKCFQIDNFEGVENFSVCTCILADFISFLLASTFNNVFKLLKMWPGGTLDVVVGTLKVSLQ